MQLSPYHSWTGFEAHDRCTDTNGALLLRVSIDVHLVSAALTKTEKELERPFHGGVTPYCVQLEKGIWKLKQRCRLYDIIFQRITSARWKAIQFAIVQYWRLLALSCFPHCSKSKWSKNRSKKQTNKTVDQTVCPGFDYSHLNFLRCCPKLKVHSLQYCNPDKTDKGRSNAGISLTWLPLN